MINIIKILSITFIACCLFKVHLYLAIAYLANMFAMTAILTIEKANREQEIQRFADHINQKYQDFMENDDDNNDQNLQ